MNCQLSGNVRRERGILRMRKLQRKEKWLSTCKSKRRKVNKANCLHQHVYLNLMLVCLKMQAKEPYLWRCLKTQHFHNIMFNLKPHAHQIPTDNVTWPHLHLKTVVELVPLSGKQQMWGFRLLLICQIAGLQIHLWHVHKYNNRTFSIKRLKVITHLNLIYQVSKTVFTLEVQDI